MSTDFIPHADAAFNSWQYQLADALFSYATAWGIPAASITQLQNQRANWDGAYSWVTNPATKTKARVLAKNEARKEYEKFLRGLLKQYITYNPAVSDRDRVNMGLPVHDTKPTPVPPPSTRPVILIARSQNHDEVLLHVRDAESGKRAKPAGTIGAVVYWLISETPVTDPEDLKFSELVTRPTHVQQFSTVERRKTVYFAARWQNAKGEKGPWSDIVSADIL